MLFQGIAAIAALLKLASNFAVFFFLVWSMYFVTNPHFGIVRGIVAFVVLGLFSGFVGMFPFGTTFAPILFEWWWHDVPFGKISTAAWTVTAFSMLANILIVIGAFGADNKSSHQS
jgi:hypothetical protein